MSVFSDLSSAERAEIDQAVLLAYEMPGGGVRTKAEATEEFLAFMASAVQAHREYADALRGEWEVAGAASFIHQRWKGMKPVSFRRDDGSTVVRSARRGTTVVDSSGVRHDVQLDLELWGREDLLQGIASAQARIESERVTIAQYLWLLDLLESTGTAFVQEGLDARGMDLDEYLASREVAA